MNSLNGNSIKIKKRPRNTSVGDRSYICGGCQKSYKSYPALYLHIKRKHGGVRPEDTRTSKPISAVPKEKIHTGRPQKVTKIFVKCLNLPSHLTTLMTLTRKSLV